MKHTNVLLKIEDEVENNEQEVRSKNLDVLQSKLRLVQELGQSKGWEFFVSELKEERRKLFSLIERANDPTTLAKITGTLLAVESFIEWPSYVARELENAAREQ